METRPSGETPPGAGADENKSSARKPCNSAVRMAVSTADRLAAFRLRYKTYVIEQRQHLAEADHRRQLLFDELDDEGDILVFEAEGSIRGTVRANLLASAVARTLYRDLFHLDRFSGVAPGEIAVCSRLALCGESIHYHRAAQTDLFQSLYERGRLQKVRLCFAACAAPLLPTLQRYGFKEFAAPIRDLIHRTSLHRTLLVMDDIDHLKKIGSPFLSSALRQSATA